MTIKTAANRIMKALVLSQHEQTQHVYMKEPVLVGHNPNGEVHCTYISDSSTGGFYLNVIFNKRDSDLYGTDYDFQFVVFNKTGTPNVSEIDYKDNNITLTETAITDIAAKLKEWGNEWVLEQREMNVKSRHYHRMAIQASRDAEKNKTKKFIDAFTWEERLEMLLINSKQDFLSWCRPINYDKKEYDKMTELGETKYKALQKHNERNMRKMLKGTMSRLKKNNDWLK